jgi:hypothetical protein
MVERRNVLKSMVALTGLSLLPACDLIPGKGSTNFQSGNLFLSTDEMAFLSSLADTIIPTTGTPGAIAAKVPETLQILLSSWASDETRGNWRKTLAALKTALDKNAGSNFSTADARMRATALDPLDAEIYAAFYAEREHPLLAYHDVKKIIGDAYYKSEPGATQELQYLAVPGHWKPREKLSKIVKTWA